MLGNIKTLARLLGLPYVPITPTFPLLGPLGLVPLPSKWIIEFGEPIPTDHYPEGAADDPMLVFNLDRPGPRDDPADAVPAARPAPQRLLLTPARPLFTGVRTFPGRSPASARRHAAARAELACGRR